MLPGKTIETAEYQDDYQELERRERKKVAEKIQFLSKNPAHPSLKVHPVKKAKGGKIWECYISDKLRLLYQIKDGILYLLSVGRHIIIDRVHLRRFKK
jgi:addiction module RelE/StbE family toxin